jgi:hypothetical protein
MNNKNILIGFPQPLLLKWLSAVVNIVFALFACIVFSVSKKNDYGISLLIVFGVTSYSIYLLLTTANVSLKNGVICIEHAIEGKIRKSFNDFDKVDIGFWNCKIYFKDGTKYKFFIGTKGLLYSLVGNNEYYSKLICKTIVDYGSRAT